MRRSDSPVARIPVRFLAKFLLHKNSVLSDSIIPAANHPIIVDD